MTRLDPNHQQLGYGEEDLRRLQDLSGQPLAGPESLCRVIDRVGYQEDWRSDYRVRSVRSSLHSPQITCIDAAILAYGLLELLFRDTKRRLLAIHRRDPRGEECGHCVALYWGGDGRVGAFSKSSFAGLDHRPPIFRDELAVATSYAQAYVGIGFVPLYFGVAALEDVAGDLDWRLGTAPLNELSERLKGCYEYSFMLDE